MKLITRVTVIILVLLSSIVVAQEEQPEWETVVFINGTPPSLVVLSSAESKNIPLPEAFSPDNRSWMAVSSDKKWLAYQTIYENDGDERIVHVANLEAGTCCDDVTPELLMNRGVDYDISALTLIDFSPFDSSLLIATQGACVVVECDGCTDECQNNMVLYNLDTGNADLLADPIGVVSQAPYYFEQLRWVPEGIRHTLPVYCMPGDYCVSELVQGKSYLTNPLTGENTSTGPEILQRYVNPIGEYLESTGEFISMYSALKQEMQISSVFAAEVVYGSPDTEPTPFGGILLELIYTPERPFIDDANPNAYFRFVKWVLGGDAVLINTVDEGSILLLRDGTQHPLELPPFSQFIATTTNGWLMMGDAQSLEETVAIYHYTWIDGVLESVPLVEVPGNPNGLVTPVVLDSFFAPGSNLEVPFKTVPEPVYESLG